MKRFALFSRYGFRWIILSGAVTFIIGYQIEWWYAIPGVLLTLWLSLYFYDPDQELPSHPLGVMSPIDGRVTGIDTIYDPFVQRDCLRIRIRANLIRTYHGRSPTEGKLKEFWPKILRSYPPYINQHTKGVWWIQTDEEDDVVMVVTSRMPFVRTSCMVQAGERIGQARRCGRFPMSCNVDILVDRNSILQVTEGSAVKAGIDTLVSFNHDKIHEQHD